MKRSLPRILPLLCLICAPDLWTFNVIAQEPPTEQLTTPATKAPSPSDKTEEAKPGNLMKMSLRRNLTFEGSPIDLETIKMSTLFGEVTLPLHTILGIHFAQGPNEQTTVVGLNGDALTGDIQLSELKFVSDWGEAKVNVSSLVSIVFRSDLAWSQTNTPNGPRWQLVRTNEGNTYSGPSPVNGGRRIYGQPR